MQEMLVIIASVYLRFDKLMETDSEDRQEPREVKKHNSQQSLF